MFWFILFGGLTLLFFLLAIWANLSFNSDIFSVLTGFSVANLFIVLVMLISLPFQKPSFERIKSEYQSTKQIIEVYEKGDYGNTPALTEKIISINEIIAEHKSKANSFWFGIWYSEEVGTLEPLTFSITK